MISFRDLKKRQLGKHEYTARKDFSCQIQYTHGRYGRSRARKIVIFPPFLPAYWGCPAIWPNRILKCGQNLKVAVLNTAVAIFRYRHKFSLAVELDCTSFLMVGYK